MFEKSVNAWIWIRGKWIKNGRSFDSTFVWFFILLAHSGGSSNSTIIYLVCVVKSLNRSLIGNIFSWFWWCGRCRHCRRRRLCMISLRVFAHVCVCVWVCVCLWVSMTIIVCIALWSCVFVTILFIVHSKIFCYTFISMLVNIYILHVRLLGDRGGNEHKRTNEKYVFCGNVRNILGCCHLCLPIKRRNKISINTITSIIINNSNSWNIGLTFIVQGRRDRDKMIEGY